MTERFSGLLSGKAKCIIANFFSQGYHQAFFACRKAGFPNNPDQQMA